ncbi:MAG: NADH dehydrogenase (quinone) subunit G [Chloroflexota bacterium]|nr:MAG: NADH dehydrogenase (quinone) subunit G [Chloroflexota bacterium]
MDNLVTLTIDGKTARVPRGTLLVEAAKTVGIHIPVFCYHEKMKPYGACRMCMVEIAPGPPMPGTACTTPVAEGMVVKTTSPMAVSAQKSTLEFLLLNHPLDCPVCDRGGECPLQDNTFGFGGAESRYLEEKRHYEKPLKLSDEVLLDRERCILCYRCVRFTREIAGDESLTVIERGTDSQIGLAPGRTFDSPFSGNTIEICPVGALTSSRYRFAARPWDIRSIATVCPHCSVGCNVRADVRNGEIKRFLTRDNPGVDDGWLCDRGRFGFGFPFDGERLTRPLARKNGQLVPVSWSEALEAIQAGISGIIEQSGSAAVAGLAGCQLTNEDLFAFRRLIRETLGSPNLDHTIEPHPATPLGADAPTGSMQAIERSNVIVLIGADTLSDWPVLNLRVKKAIDRGAKVVVLGSQPLDVNAAPYREVFVNTGGDDSAVLSAISRLLPAEIDAARERRRQAAEAAADRAFADAVKRAHDAAVAKAKEANQDEPAAYASVDEGATRYGVNRPAPLPAPPLRTRGRDALVASLTDAAAPGVSVDTLASMARLVGGGERVSILYPREYGADAKFLTAVTNFGLLCEAFGREGAGIFPLVRETNQQGAIDIGVMAGQGGIAGAGLVEAIESGKVQGLFLAGRDLAGANLDALAKLRFLVVQDFRLTQAAARAHVVLPGLTFAEKDGTYTNLDRRIQRLRVCADAPGEARPDWRIFRDIGNAFGGDAYEQSAEEMLASIAASTPDYAAVTLGKLGYKGVQWPYANPDGAGSRTLHDGREFDLLPINGLR